MKNKIIIILLSVSFVINGCKKKSEEVEPSNQTENVSFRINPVVGNSAVNFFSSFSTNAGQRYTLSMFRYYLSNIRLVKNDGTEYPISDKYFLVSPSITDYDLGQVPVGEYKGVKFSIGIDSATNHKDPTVYPTNNPLSIQSPAIHWSWNSGYIFMMIEGSCDTTAGDTDVLTYGQYSHGMFFHIGMDELYRNVDLSNNSFSITKDNPKVITIQADVNKLFTNVDLKTENESHTMGSMPLATKIADNISTIFTIVQ